jgi:ferrous iron transport protein B
MLASLLGTSDFTKILGFGQVQMIVFTLVAMLYIPCISTIACLIKEIGWKNTVLITVFEIIFAIIVGGIAFRILTFTGIL